MNSSNLEPRKVVLIKNVRLLEYFTHSNGSCKHPYTHPYQIDIFINLWFL